MSNFRLVRKRKFFDKQIKFFFFQDTILSNAREYDVAFLVGGDPLSATTHTDLILRAVQLNIPYKIIHNASIMNAIGSCGLQVK